MPPKLAGLVDLNALAFAGRGRLVALLEARLRERDKLHAERSRRFIPLARSLAENEDESDIIGMLLDDYYQQSLHAPLVQPAGTPAAAEPARSSSGGRRRPRRRGR